MGAKNIFLNVKGFVVKKFHHLVIYPIHGLISFFRDESSARYLVLGTIATYVGAYFGDFSGIEYLLISSVIVLAFIVELLNSAIENVVDLATDKIHPLAKKAKDQAATAEAAIVLLWVTVALLIFFDVISM